MAQHTGEETKSRETFISCIFSTASSACISMHLLKVSICVPLHVYTHKHWKMKHWKLYFKRHWFGVSLIGWGHSPAWQKLMIKKNQKKLVNFASLSCFGLDYKGEDTASLK